MPHPALTHGCLQRVPAARHPPKGVRGARGVPGGQVPVRTRGSAGAQRAGGLSPPSLSLQPHVPALSRLAWAVMGQPAGARGCWGDRAPISRGALPPPAPRVGVLPSLLAVPMAALSPWPSCCLGSRFGCHGSEMLPLPAAPSVSCACVTVCVSPCACPCALSHLCTHLYTHLHPQTHMGSLGRASVSPNFETKGQKHSVRANHSAGDQAGVLHGAPVPLFPSSDGSTFPPEPLWHRHKWAGTTDVPNLVQ